MFSAALPVDRIEIHHDFAPRPRISHVILDFDGTLSWLRHGWPEIMEQLFREHLPALPGESEAAIHELLLADILALNGHPSIHQMNRLVERVRERGGHPPDPEELLLEYQRRLDDVITHRSEKILNGTAAPDEFVVHGARVLLEQLRQRGVTLFILSGTVEHRVRQEAELLGLSKFFGTRIHGSSPEYPDFSKREVIDRILREEKIPGDRLLSIGDGPVEMEYTRAVGGFALAVASDENQNGSGVPDPWKRRQLLAAGAHALIADYREPDALLKRIFGS